jgi:hypothetical protein
MSRSSTMQFAYLSRAEAEAFLRRCALTSDTVGDRIAAARRLDFVTTAEERAAVRACNAELGYDERGHRLAPEEATT